MTDKKEQIVTPKGIVGPYPAIDKVDYGTDQYPDADGSYKCEIRLNKNDPKVKDLLKRFDDMVPAIEKEAEAFKKKQLKAGKKVDITINPLYRVVFDEEGEETELVALKAKTKASGINKKTNEQWERKLRVEDSKGTPIKKALGISTGSTIRMAFTLGDIYVNPKAGAGRAFYLDAIRLLELVQYGAESAFDDEDEGGYEYDDSDAQEETQTTTTSSFDEEEDNDDEPDFAS